MPRRTSILRNVALAAPLLISCGSTSDETVPGCPHCGDPPTVETPSGNRVIPRLRLPPKDVDPLATTLRREPPPEQGAR